MTNETRDRAGISPHHCSARHNQLAGRIADLYARDPQFRAAEPIAGVLEAARRPGLRLPQILETLTSGYADRPALGWRAREPVTDPASGRTTTRLLPRFQTTDYRDLWADVRSVASVWRQDPMHPVGPGSVVAIVGFTSPAYLTVDLVCGYLGLVAVPLQHSAPVTRLRSILAEIEPQVLAVGAEYLNSVVEAVLDVTSLQRVVVFDYQPRVDDQREALARARARLEAAGMAVIIETLDATIEHGRTSPPVAMYTGGTDERLAMILYTSGSTGSPKGAMYSERMVSRLWTTAQLSDAQLPVLNVNYLPMNHAVSRLHLASCFQAGGTAFFVPASDLSTLLDDWKLVRPTDIGLVPAVVGLLFERYQRELRHVRARGVAPDEADAAAKAELRERLLGGRVIGCSCTSAPLAADMGAFLESCLGVPITDDYGLTETGGIVIRAGAVQRPPVIDYQLADVPELGYFGTDRPYPRGELLIKTQSITPGYYKRPDATADAFDTDGYYRTGDVMAEIEPDHLVYVDRRNNVLKLAQGEFVAISRLEAVFGLAPLIHQIFVYGNSERSGLLAVVVPTPDALGEFRADPGGLTAALSESLHRAANDAELASYELPVGLLVEQEPFSMDNGLLSAAGKLLRPKLRERYGERLEQLYTELATARVDELRTLRESAGVRPVLDTLTRAARALLETGVTPDPDLHFIELGGDSLSALTFADLLSDVFGVEVPVGAIIGQAASLRQLADYVTAKRESDRRQPTLEIVHGADTTEIRATDLTLDKFIESPTLENATALSPATGEPRTVLLTGANGYLGRFLCLNWLYRLSQTGGKLICLVRGPDPDAVRERLSAVFDSEDDQLGEQVRALSADHLDVIAADVGEPNLGLDLPTWDRLSRQVDLIVHAAALVNHVLPYGRLFGPNVVGTAELIRLAVTNRIKSISYISTVAVAEAGEPADFTENGDIRQVSPVRVVDDSYANGYANSKWAGEVLLRQAYDLCRLPVAVFRCNMVLAHTRYAGQLNVPDSFTRLILSILATGLAPRSFYQSDDGGERPRAHYDGLPVDFIAESIITLGERAVAAADFRCFNVRNPHDDGVSLDVFVDWLTAAGNDICRIDDYQDWLDRFETALRALPDRQRRASVLPLIGAYRKPARRVPLAAIPCEVFRSAVQRGKLGGDGDIPHLSEPLIRKYVTDLHHVGLL